MSAVSASRTGTIAYAGIISQAGRLQWIDRAGTVLAPTGTPDGDYTDFRLSPDETQLAASLFDPKTNAVEIWLTDLAREQCCVAAAQLHDSVMNRPGERRCKRMLCVPPAARVLESSRRILAFSWLSFV